MAYWIFQTGGGGKNDYQLQKRLAVAKTQPETATRVQEKYRNLISPGDQLLVWQKRKIRGYVAIIEVTLAPTEMAETKIEIPFCPDPQTHVPLLRVRGKYTKVFPLLPEADVAADPIAGKHYFFDGNYQKRRGTIHPLTDAEAKAILRLVTNNGRCLITVNSCSR